MADTLDRLKTALSDRYAIERFFREIRITANMHHPHDLTLIDSGEADGFL